MQNQYGNLFNINTIKKITSNISLTEKQIESANQWIMKLNENMLKDEVQNYPQFALLVLNDILGYEIKEWKLNRDNVEFSFRKSAGEKGVVIEVKGSSTNLFARQYRNKLEHVTPIEQTWNYIGKSTFDYGITTNYKEFVLIDRSIGFKNIHIFNFLDIKKI